MHPLEAWGEIFGGVCVNVILYIELVVRGLMASFALGVLYNPHYMYHRLGNFRVKNISCVKFLWS